MPLSPNEVKTEHIASGAVTTPKIADEAVSSAKIKNSAVTGEKLATGAVTGDKLAANAVTGSKIRDGIVRAEKIAPGAVTTAKIAEAAVTASRLAGNAVTAEKIANSAVTGPKIADGSISQAKLSFTPPSVARPITPPVTTDEIGALQVTNSKLQDSAVTASKLATNAVETAKIKDGAVTPTKLSFAVPTRPLVPPIATAEIADLQITNAKLQDGSVTTPKIADAQITNAKLQDASVTVTKVDAVNAPVDGYALTYEQASGRHKYAPAGGSKFTLINPQLVFDETTTSDRSAPLSVATVVPATAVGVLVELHQDGQVPSWAQPSTQVQHQLGGVALTCYITGNAAGNMPMYADNAGIVPVYSPQNIYLVINRVGVSTRVKVTVVGYIE